MSYAFDGSTMYAVIAGGGWKPLGLPFTISGQVKPASALGSGVNYIVASDATSFGVKADATTNYYNMDYEDVDAATIESGADLASVATVGVWMTFSTEFTASGVTTTLNGGTATVDTELPKSVTMSTIECISTYQTASFLTGFPGVIKDLHLTDGTGLQNRSLCLGNGSRFLTLNAPIPVVFANGFVIEFDYKRYDFGGAALSFLVGSTSSTEKIQVYDSDHSSSSDNLAIKAGGATRTWTNALANVAQGQVCHLKITYSGSGNMELFVDGVSVGTVGSPSGTVFNIDYLYSSNGSGNRLKNGSALGNFSVTDSTTNDTWFYALEQLV